MPGCCQCSQRSRHSHSSNRALPHDDWLNHLSCMTIGLGRFFPEHAQGLVCINTCAENGLFGIVRINCMYADTRMHPGARLYRRQDRGTTNTVRRCFLECVRVSRTCALCPEGAVIFVCTIYDIRFTVRSPFADRRPTAKVHRENKDLSRMTA
ncbi:hypothetical protein BDW22DRAFT_123097 [Trametopsis cervina]|nr:hypothetical protein BDW22DRAFT_123097 [Trametopsis cervina]